MPDTPSREQQVFDVLMSWYSRHRFYRDPTNDTVVLGRIAAEICAAIAPPPHMARYTAHCSACGVTATGSRDECEKWRTTHWAAYHANTEGVPAT
jgi:hypothetical protein